jgi:hypothetical protein
VGISRDYPLKTRTSKQLIGEIPGFEIILSHPLKYPRSKQGLKIDIKINELIINVLHSLIRTQVDFKPALDCSI